MLRTGRTLKGASLLLSIALHATLVASLLKLRDGDPTGQPILTVRLEASGLDAVAEAPAAEDVADAAAPAPTEDALPEPEAEPPEPEPAAPPAPAVADTAADQATVAESRERAEPDTPRPVELAAVRVDSPRLIEPPLPAPVVTTVAMSTPHAALLSEHAASWAADIAVDALPADTVLHTQDGQAFDVEFTRRAPADDMGLEHVIASVTTVRDGATLRAEMTLTRLAFSSFAQLIDRWDPSVQIHDDEIDGRFHANSEIYIDDSGAVQPTFHGKVTTSRGINTSGSRRRVRRNEVFLGGLETRARRIVLPRELAPEGEHVHRFDQDTRIVFLGDGTYTHAPLEAPTPESLRTLPDAPAYLVGDRDAELHVSGTVNGRVLVFSAAGIVVAGDLLYAADPFSDPDADDYLGLASDRSVEIAAPEVTGPGDLKIQAAIYAKGRFAVSRYRSREDATLFIDGSVTAGSLTATEPRFRTRLRFDPRFDRARPPGFPLTDRYELTTRDAVWRMADR